MATAKLEGGVAERRKARRETRRQQKRLVPWRRTARILLVEDDAEMRAMVASCLRRDGYTVIEAADGDGALDWLGPGVLEGELERTPDLIVSDIRLPYFSGLDILEGLSIAATPVPVILITGFGDDETHAKARELGARCVLDKPFDLVVLRGAVRSVLESLGLDGQEEPDSHVV
jgi:DNA-binding response OmpR family regulator